MEILNYITPQGEGIQLYLNWRILWKQNEEEITF